MKKFLVTFMLAAFLIVPATVMADSISPDSYSNDTLGIGESVTITKTVTVSEEPSTTAPVDVFFLTDSTGSMGGQIAAVKAAASNILSETAGLGDLRWGAGEYRDIYDTFTYRTNQGLTGDTTAVQTGINQWAAGGGGDFYEANIYALEQVAETVSWRDDATKILVWFGDAPGHDPRAGSSEVSATEALVAEGIAVQAVDVGSLNSTGQAARIADATGGAFYDGISTGDLVETIIDSIVSELDEYTSVNLGVIGDSGPIAVSWNPSEGYMGDFDRSVEMEFSFDVTFERTAAGDAEFMIGAFVDDGLVARERDSFGGGPTGVPEPSTVLLLGLGLLGLAGVGRRKIKN